MTNKLVKLPQELSAENGAKYLFIGEFFEEATISCVACCGEDGDCEHCRGSGEYVVKVPVSWTTIKNIYEKAVGFFDGQSDGKTRYSQGACQDGAAILKDGVLMTVDEVVKELNT